MARLFDEHTRRPVHSLNGPWRLLPDPEDLGETEAWFRGLNEGRTVVVPSVWNGEQGLRDYEGAVWYEKRFFSPGGCARLCFDGVLTYGKVWLDGAYLGDHYGGFTTFDFLIPSLSPGDHRLILRVDNRFDGQSIPQKRVDWYHYGGIIRDVTLELLTGTCVLRSRMEYTLSEDLREAECRFVLDCFREDGTEDTGLTITMDGHPVYTGTLSLPAGRSAVALPAFRMEDPVLWEPGRPKLYTVCVRTDTDDLTDRVGFRTIAVENGKILLNGKPVTFHGINRHEEYPEFGFAFPPSRMLRDVDLIRDLGCNAVRGAHYPQSRMFLDYMDEQGLLFWSEIPIWGGGFSRETLGDPLVLDRGMQMHREMVSQYYNHPSIVLWGMHNEILTDTAEAEAMTQAYYTFLKKNGGGRLVVYATAQPMNDRCLAWTDVICVNKYFGWYEGELTQWDTFLRTFLGHRAELGLTEKPLIISEFGAAAIYGVHDTEKSKWSEEYQAELLRYCLALFESRDEIAGSFVWQFCDLRTCPEMGFSRGRGFNNKGILDEYRRPKAAYYAVREKFRS